MELQIKEEFSLLLVHFNYCLVSEDGMETLRKTIQVVSRKLNEKSASIGIQAIIIKLEAFKPLRLQVL